MGRGWSRAGLVFFFLFLDGLDVVGRQHAGLAGALHCAVHPALVDGLHVDDDVAVLEGDLVAVGGRVVVHGAHGLLRRGERERDGGG